MVNTRIQPELYNALKLAADDSGMSISAYIRHCLTIKLRQSGYVSRPGGEK
jgi:hypothetical protein